MTTPSNPPQPGHATVCNNGGFCPPTKYMLELPDGRIITFQLTTPDPMKYAADWLKENAPDVPLHPEFIVTL